MSISAAASTALPDDEPGERRVDGQQASRQGDIFDDAAGIGDGGDAADLGVAGREGDIGDDGRRCHRGRFHGHRRRKLDDGFGNRLKRRHFGRRFMNHGRRLDRRPPGLGRKLGLAAELPDPVEPRNFKKTPTNQFIRQLSMRS